MPNLPVWRNRPGLQEGTRYEFGVETRTTSGRSSEGLGVVIATTLNSPVANPDFYETAEDQELLIAAAGVLENDTDADGDTLTAELVSGPANGTVIFNSDGSFLYTPQLDFQGKDTFTYKAVDTLDAESNVTTVTIRVLSSAEQQVAQLRLLVNELCEAGVLNEGQCNSLLVKLQHVETKIVRGQFKVSANLTHAFEREIVAFESANLLTTEQAEPLLTLTQRLRQSLLLGADALA